MYITRITADIDDKRKTMHSVRRLVWNTAMNFSLEVVSFNVTRSQNGGWHAALYVAQRLKEHEVISIRWYLGDDRRRIRKDMKRKHPRQYLFYKKVKLK